MSDWKTVDELEKMQETTPVFLTSGCCESAHGSIELFRRLKLRHGWFNTANGSLTSKEPQEPTEEDFYPLTPPEDQYIGEDYANGPYGGIVMAYTVLYKGKKWLAPTIQVCWLSGVFSEDSYGGEVAKDYEISIKAAEALEMALRPKMEVIGGDVVLLKDDEEDRHSVMMLFPPDFAIKQAKNFEEWKKFLTAFCDGISLIPLK